MLMMVMIVWIHASMQCFAENCERYDDQQNRIHKSRKYLNTSVTEHEKIV